ncbi:MAG: hypothetical protein ACD_17C00394G0004 [uncultured bacterium]|nr:MAG: hypothetical protein ACD_17C00394G0004 [uncultured bacterium]OGN55502.1 MAG: hypothetical protein A2796_05310 [Chlamydiae bacterium RIFCSPHIGHO2_01_FULL_44_39]OGN57067.1 MAG: hypothetical protein A3C42_05965 [Chlamydiae bacterium RIFCSPHIGHO2_02_FULL_45_9]OGN60002.1 MAG: hypothetical protein A3D96_02585 [Chlamydiae bacterium RIFCSPHIGHO2_12_FULL_44_59]OGN65929.1 MAG: hypothetical protein A2978_06400 [Chlamydiae bacterium RIFCSPLOWO2_01_FULL_44_52]OGN68189.1 MAG: hypothetical protein A3
MGKVLTAFREVVLIFLLAFAFPLQAYNAKSMGSLLSDPPTAISYRHFVVRNFLFFDGHRGIYESHWQNSSRKDSYHSYRYQFQGFFGLNDFFDVSLFSQFYFNNQGRYAYCNVGDLTVGLDFQLLEDDRYLFFPGIKFAVREIFPLGHYQLFNPKRAEMEKTGSGCFSTQFALFLYKQYLFFPNWLLSTTLAMQYQFNSWVSVKGLHSYGGGFGTNGKIWVGHSWQSLVNMQIFYKNSLFFSLDGLYEHMDASPFYGHPGLSFYGTYCNTHQPSSERVSLAPSLGYQCPSGIGIMIGNWFSLCGRNAEQFSQYAANLFYIF